MSEYYLLSTTTMNPCTLQRSAYEEARKTWLCTGCGFPKPDVRAVDVAIQERTPDDTPLNVVFGCGTGIAKKSFLYAVGESIVNEHLYTGRVFGPSGELLTDWISFNGKYKIILRGSENVGVRRCDECGRNVYFATGKRYLYPTPTGGVRIFHAGNGRLIMTEDLVMRLNLNAWRKLECTKLPVLSCPLDGLVDLKSLY